MTGRFLTVRFRRLPTTVIGPRTRWIVALDHYGKNGCKATLLAKCVTNGKSVVLYDGRAAVTEGTAYVGFHVQIGTIACKIVAAAVAQGVAEFVDQSDGQGGPDTQQPKHPLSCRRTSPSRGAAVSPEKLK